MAAPVIWLGSWLLSLMACSGCAAVARFLQLDARKNKKGPEEAPCTPPVCGWPQPPPAVRLGTTTIRSLVIILRMRGLLLPKGCAKHSVQTPEVKGRQPIARIQSLAV